MRILVVDDNKDVRECYRYFLEQLHHAVAEAETGTEALKVALKFKPELVLMDLALPDISGAEAAAAFRAISTFTYLPIIAMTAQSGRVWEAKARAAGCDGYLEKPITKTIMAQTIEKFRRAVPC